MPIEVEAPDGSVVEFPDGMSQDQIAGVMRQQFGGSQAQPAAPDGGGGFGDGAHAFLGGAIEGVPIVGPYIRSGIESAATGVHSLFTGTNYDENRARLDAMNAQTSEAHPYAETAGNITGAVGSMIPLGMTAAGARALGITGGGLGARTMAAGASGGAIGGADAAVRSGGDAKATLQGAALGGVLGANAPWVGQAIGAGTRRVAEALGSPGAKGRAATAAARALADDDLTPALARQRLTDLGDDAMLADLGPNLQRQAGAIAATPGRGQKAIRGAIAGRQQGAGGRVTQAADRALGQPVDAVAAVDDLIATRSAQSGPAYRAAYQQGERSIISPEIERLMGAPDFVQAMKSASTTGKNRAIAEGFGGFNPAVQVTDDGRVLFARSQGGVPTYPNLQFWDYTKRELDRMAGIADRAGDSNAGVLRNMARTLREELDKVVPAYRSARDVFAGQSAMLDAMEEGQKVFARSVSPGALRKQLAGMSGSERVAFQQGARAQIADMMGTARNDALKARQIFDQGYNREKLRMLLGDEQAESLLRQLEAEKAFTATRDVVTGNSETAARMAAQKELGGGAASEDAGILRSLLNLRVGDALAKGGDMVTKGARTSRQANVRDQLADILTRGPRSPGLLEELTAAQMRRELAERLGGQAGRGAHLGVMGVGQALGR